MRYKVVINDPRAIVKEKKRVWESRVLPKLADVMLADCNTYARMQSGDLIRVGTPENGGKQLVWDTPYAKKVYYTGTPSKARNPNASLRWCEVAKRKHKQEWVDMANNLLKG